MQGRQATPAQPLHVAQGAGNHPVAQRHDQAALLGQRHELVRAEQAAFGMAPAHQRLQAEDAPALQAQAWLVVQLQLVATQGTAQLAFQIGHAARAAMDALVVQVMGTALGGLGLLHGDMRMPQQRIGALAGTGVGQAQAAAKQQALAVQPVGLGQHLGDALGHALGALRIAAVVDEQGELVTAQARQRVTGLQLGLEAVDHLQDQAVAGLVAEGVVDVLEVVQVEVAEGQAASLVLGQTPGQQGLEALAVGDTGQRVLFGQALQGRLQPPALAGIAQAAAQQVDAEVVAHQPVTDIGRLHNGLLVEQQDGRQRAAPGRRLAGGRGQQQAVPAVVEQAAGRLPVRCGDQRKGAAEGLESRAQQGSPLWLFGQQDQAQGFDVRGQMTSPRSGKTDLPRLCAPCSGVLFLPVPVQISAHPAGKA